MHEVRRQIHENSSLADRLEDERDFVLLEIPESAMNELARARTRSKSEVVHLDEDDGEPAPSSIARNAGAIDSTPHDQQIDVVFVGGGRQSRT